MTNICSKTIFAQSFNSGTLGLFLPNEARCCGNKQSPVSRVKSESRAAREKKENRNNKNKSLSG